MKLFTVCLLFEVLINRFLLSDAGLRSYGHWQCKLSQNKSLHDVVSNFMQWHFQITGFSPWMLDKRIYISCMRRGLSMVPSGLNSRVQILNLQENTITHIRRNDFLTYKNLEAIILRKNCLSANIHRSAIPYCSQNRITIGLGAFSELSNLIYLDLSDNNVKTVPENLPNSLKILLMDSTQLGQLKAPEVKNLENLQFVFLGSNCIRPPAMSILCNNNFSIENVKFSSRNLSFLDLSSDNLSEIPQWLFTPNLVGIGLQFNPIHVVRRTAFSTCPNIKYLDLSWTSHFDKIPMVIKPGAFDNLTQLIQLDLSGNMLSTLPDFSLLSKIRSIELDCNCLKLSAFNLIAISALPLTHLVINGNTYCRPESNDSYPNKRRIQTLQLGDAFLNLTNLETLELGKFFYYTDPKDSTNIERVHRALAYGYQYNYVSKESLQVLQKLPNLKTLSLAFSGIKSIDMSMFCNFNVRYLDLSANEIQNLLEISSVFKRSTRKKYNFLKSPEYLLYSPQLYKQNLIKQYSNSLLLSRNALSSLPNDAFKCFSETTYLDLSLNHISYIQRAIFEHMSKLQILNLQFNPIRQIYSDPKKGLSKLNTLMLNYSSYQGDFTLHFLLNTSINVKLSYGDITDNIFHLLRAYRKNSTQFHSVISITFTDIPIPIYDILSDHPIFKPFPNLQSITLRGAQLSTLLGNHFFSGVSKTTKVILSDCKLREVPFRALKALPWLRYLDLSHNYINSLNISWISFISNLTFLRLSFNYISHIDPNVLHCMVQNGLRTLDLQSNYISDVRPSIIDQYVLSNLQFLDLRGNALVCDCSLNQNFGWLIYSNNSQLELPGFLPMCPPVMIDYYGGCLTCKTVENAGCRSQTLFLYSLSDICQKQSLSILTISFTTFIIIFILSSLACKCKPFRNWLIKSLLKANFGQVQKETERTDAASSIKHAYDAFVVYDTTDSSVGDWVDAIVIPNLESGVPSFKLGVVEKEDWSGGLISEVQQLLLRMEASYKTIVLLTDEFAKSLKCRYVLSVLEQWTYTQGEDRSIIVTFKNQPPSGKGFQLRRLRNQFSVLNISNVKNDNFSFLELLRHAILAKRYHT